jgi:hypothetical protein
VSAKTHVLTTVVVDGVLVRMRALALECMLSAVVPLEKTDISGPTLVHVLLCGLSCKRPVVLVLRMCCIGGTVRAVCIVLLAVTVVLAGLLLQRCWRHQQNHCSPCAASSQAGWSMGWLR